MKKIIFWWALLLPLLIINTVFGANYILNSNSVDTSWGVNEIRWWGFTKYTSEWNSVVSAWNAYGDVNIAPDTVFTYDDLTIDDVYVEDVTWSGRWWASAWADDLELNTWFMDGHSYAGTYTSSQKKHNIGHELGHAHWLDHHSISSNFLQSWKRSVTSLWTQDKKDYDYLMDNVYPNQ